MAIPYSANTSVTAKGSRVTTVPVTIPAVARLSESRGPLSVGPGGKSSSELQSVGGLTPTAISGVATAVWNELKASHTTPGTYGYLLDAQVSGVGGSAPTAAAIRAEIDTNSTQLIAIKTKTDNLPGSPAAVGSAMTLTSGERTSVATAVWDFVVEGTIKAKEGFRLLLSRASAKATVEDNGDGTTTITYRDIGDTKDRIVGTIDNTTGSVTAVTTRDGT